MDCDGFKKLLIRDLDGSVLGSPGTLIADAAFEWGGDKRRGLGDYRIPTVMVTELDGSRIPYDDKLPNKGRIVKMYIGLFSKLIRKFVIISNVNALIEVHIKKAFVKDE